MIFVVKEGQEEMPSGDGAGLPKFRKNGQRSYIPGIGVILWE